MTAYPHRTSPVLRGKWILENLLGTPHPAATERAVLEDTTAEGEVLSMRERMEQHRANPVCASCHRLMDPPGFALENFDAVGRWRDRGESSPPSTARAPFRTAARSRTRQGSATRCLVSPSASFRH